MQAVKSQTEETNMSKHWEVRDGYAVSQATRLHSVKTRRDISGLNLLAYAVPAVILAAFSYPLFAFVAEFIALFTR